MRLLGYFCIISNRAFLKIGLTLVFRTLKSSKLIMVFTDFAEDILDRVIVTLAVQKLVPN
jgi:hypothetical protein